MSELLEKCTLAKDAGYKMVSVSTVTKDNALEAIANALVERADEIIAANNIDIENAKKNGTRQAMIDRLTLTKERIDGIAEGVRQVKALADPIGEVIKTKRIDYRSKTCAYGRYCNNLRGKTECNG